MVHPPVVIVDRQDRVVGAAPLKDVWAKGLYHRVVRIMVEDQSGRILLQRRRDNMELFPGCWETSASGHVDKGFSYEQTAKQEVAEEIGIAHPKLSRIDTYFEKSTYQGKHMNVFARVYRTQATEDIRPGTDEVAELRWFTVEEARRLVRFHPDQVTYGLREVIEHYYDDPTERPLKRTLARFRAAFSVR